MISLKQNVDFIKNNLIKGTGWYNNERFPIKYLVYVYKKVDGDEYLSVKDAKILGFEYNKEDKKEICDFEYHESLEKAGLLSILIDKLVNDLIPNTESISDEGEEDLKKMYEDRLERIWSRMPDSYEG